MKVLEPTQLMRQDVFGGVSKRGGVIGAVALEVALAGRDARSAATTDVDGAVSIASAAAAISRLEEAGLKPSGEAHERGYTWVRDGLKTQLIRPPARVNRPPVSGLAENVHFSLVEKYRESVASAERRRSHGSWWRDRLQC